MQSGQSPNVALFDFVCDHRTIGRPTISVNMKARPASASDTAMFSSGSVGMIELVKIGRYKLNSVFIRWLQGGHDSLHLEPAGSLQQDDVAFRRFPPQIRDQGITFTDGE